MAMYHSSTSFMTNQCTAESGLPSVLILCHDDRGQVFQIDLVYNARSRWHNTEVIKSLLCPAQQRITLAVTLIFAPNIAGKCQARAKCINLYRVIDDQVRWHQWVNLAR